MFDGAHCRPSRKTGGREACSSCVAEFDPSKCFLRTFRLEKLGMNEMSQKLRTLYDSWSRARKIRIGVNCVDTAIAHRWKVRPARIAEQLWCLLDHLIQVEATGREDQDFGAHPKTSFQGMRTESAPLRASESIPPLSLRSRASSGHCSSTNRGSNLDCSALVSHFGKKPHSLISHCPRSSGNGAASRKEQPHC